MGSILASIVGCQVICKRFGTAGCTQRVEVNLDGLALKLSISRWISSIGKHGKDIIVSCKSDAKFLKLGFI